MDKQVLKVLKKLYYYDNVSYNKKKETIHSEDVLSPKEKSILLDYGWETNNIEYFSSHSEVLEKLFSLKNDNLLSKKRSIDAFVPELAEVIYAVFLCSRHGIC